MQDKIIINDYIRNDPLSEDNLDKTLETINEIHLLFPQKTIWIYSGYKVKEVYNNKFILSPSASDIVNTESENIIIEESNKDKIRSEIISQCTVLIDGRYIDSQRDINLKYRGSKNQRVIDIQQSLKRNEVILYCE